MVEEVEMVVVGGYRQCIDVVVGRWRVQLCMGRFRRMRYTREGFVVEPENHRPRWLALVDQNMYFGVGGLFVAAAMGIELVEDYWFEEGEALSLKGREEQDLSVGMTVDYPTAEVVDQDMVHDHQLAGVVDQEQQRKKGPAHYVEEDKRQTEMVVVGKAAL